MILKLTMSKLKIHCGCGLTKDPENVLSKEILSVTRMRVSFIGNPLEMQIAFPVECVELRLH
jgi:hypothetical protein